MYAPGSFDAASGYLTAALGESSIEVSLADMWAELD
jgi:hypothetical protein